MSLQFLYFRIQSFFHYIFESLTMRTKPRNQYVNVSDEEEGIYLNESFTIER